MIGEVMTQMKSAVSIMGFPLPIAIICHPFFFRAHWENGNTDFQSCAAPPLAGLSPESKSWEINHRLPRYAPHLSFFYSSPFLTSNFSWRRADLSLE